MVRLCRWIGYVLMLAQKTLCGSSGRFSAEIVDSDTAQTNTNSPTFSSMALGAPHPNRLMIGLFDYWDNDVTDSPSTADTTFNGVSGDLVYSYLPASGGISYGVLIRQAIVTSGSSGDVMMTLGGFAGTVDSWGCTLVQATNLLSTTSLRQAYNESNGTVHIDTTGAKFVTVMAIDRTGNLSARTPVSNSGSSTLILGHRHSHGLAFIDTTPPGGAVTYSINGYSNGDPDLLIAACWG